MIALKKNKNLQEIIGGHTVIQRKILEKSLYGQNGKSLPWSSSRTSLCCAQIVNTQIFLNFWNV